MKRDVCAVVADQPVPAGRFRPVVWYKSASNPRKTGIYRYAKYSNDTTTFPRPHPRAYASTQLLSRSSPAIPRRFDSSV